MRHAIRLIPAVLLLLGPACGRDTSTLQPASPITDPVVFADDFGSSVIFEAFLGTRVDAVSVDDTESAVGSASLRMRVPAPGDARGAYAGGAMPAFQARDLSGYDALSFFARADRDITLDVAGFGNDNTGESRYPASVAGLSLTTAWQQYILPIPRPDRLTSERGMFFFAESPENGQASTVWFDDVRFVNTDVISNPRPAVLPQFITGFVGTTVSVTNPRTVFSVDGTDVQVDHSPNYFTFFSSVDSVATIESEETIRVVGPGTTNISGKLIPAPGDTANVNGRVVVLAIAPPAAAAPAPTFPARDVISVFSNPYRDVPVDRWSADFDRADFSDLVIDGSDVKAYTNVATFAAIEFVSNQIDATEFANFHLDVWIPDGTVFRAKLVDFGPDGEFGGGDDSESEVSLFPSSDPALELGTWVRIDVPLDRFLGLNGRANLAQLILSGPRTFYIDNILFHR